MPKFQFVEAVFGYRTIEIRAANLEAARTLYTKHGASDKSRDCRVTGLKVFDAFLTEVSDEAGKLLEDHNPPVEESGDGERSNQLGGETQLGARSELSADADQQVAPEVQAAAQDDV